MPPESWTHTYSHILFWHALLMFNVQLLWPDTRDNWLTSLTRPPVMVEAFWLFTSGRACARQINLSELANSGWPAWNLVVQAGMVPFLAPAGSKAGRVQLYKEKSSKWRALSLQQAACAELQLNGIITC